MKYLLELHTYDKILKLKDWHEREKEKIDNIKDYKKWKLKNDIAFKKYLKEIDKLSKEKDAYALKGDMNSKYLYHYTNVDSCIQIVESNEMLTGEYGISFTTNPNLYKRGFVFWYPNDYSKGRHNKNTGVKIKFDFEAMKWMDFETGNEELGTLAGEEEIRMMFDSIEEVNKYIIEVIVLKNKEEESDKIPQLIKLLKEKNIKHKVV